MGSSPGARAGSAQPNRNRATTLDWGYRTVPRILSTASAAPPHRLSQAQARGFAQQHFASGFSDVDRLLPVFDHAGIEGRDLCKPPEWFLEHHSFEEKNREYIDWAERLGQEAAEACLARAGVEARDVDHVIFVSTTGLATPSMDARLAQILGLSHHVRRTPLFGLGCAGGTMGLSHAVRSALAIPESLVLCIAVETTSLTFLYEDLGKSNLVATALFGDGAAAVLVAGDRAPGRGPTVVGTRSTLFDDSIDVMGWNFLDQGMQVVFSRAIPGLVTRHSRTDITSFLAEHGIGIDDIRSWIVHPGGTRVIEAYEQALGLPEEALGETRAVLRDHGNMSSATVFYVLERFLGAGRPEPGEYALMTALGPGFSSEHVLLVGN